MAKVFKKSLMIISTNTLPAFLNLYNWDLEKASKEWGVSIEELEYVLYRKIPAPLRTEKGIMDMTCAVHCWLLGVFSSSGSIDKHDRIRLYTTDAVLAGYIRDILPSSTVKVNPNRLKARSVYEINALSRGIYSFFGSEKADKKYVDINTIPEYYRIFYLRGIFDGTAKCSIVENASGSKYVSISITANPKVSYIFASEMSKIIPSLSWDVCPVGSKLVSYRTTTNNDSIALFKALHQAHWFNPCEINTVQFKECFTELYNQKELYSLDDDAKYLILDTPIKPFTYDKGSNSFFNSLHNNQGGEFNG